MKAGFHTRIFIKQPIYYPCSYLAFDFRRVLEVFELQCSAWCEHIAKASHVSLSISRQIITNNE
jgi:hypothetical protein